MTFRDIPLFKPFAFLVRIPPKGHGLDRRVRDDKGSVSRGSRGNACIWGQTSTYEKEAKELIRIHTQLIELAFNLKHFLREIFHLERDEVEHYLFSRQ